MQIMYRPVQEKDAVELVVLMGELGYPLRLEEIQNRLAEIQDRGHMVFVAEVDGAVVGCVNALVDIRLAAGIYGEIVSLVVTGPCRNRGIGKGLVACAETWLRTYCDRIRIRANRKRMAAPGFYRSLGYKEIKTQRIFTKEFNEKILPEGT